MQGKRVLVIGRGMFGRRVAAQLEAQPDVDVVVAARTSTVLSMDVRNSDSVHKALAEVRPSVVVDTAGPFQARTDSVHLAKAALSMNAHYVDISDSHAYSSLMVDQETNTLARERGLAVVSGASTFPAVTAAVCDRYTASMAQVDDIHIAFASGNQNESSPATMASILGDLDTTHRVFRDGRWQESVNWDVPQRVLFHGSGLRRWCSNVDQIDTAEFPQRYGVTRNVTTLAGLEIGSMVWGTWLLGKLKRHGVLRSIPQRPLELVHKALQPLGTKDGTLRVVIRGTDAQGQPVHTHWSLLGTGGDGPMVAATPAALVTRKLLDGHIEPGASLCMGHVSLEEMEDYWVANRWNIHAVEDGIGSDETGPFMAGLGRKHAKALPAFFRRFHADKGLVDGVFDITRAPGLIGFLCDLRGLPKPGSRLPTVVVSQGGQWARFFGDNNVMLSRWDIRGGLVVEMFWPLAFGFHLLPILGPDGSVQGFSHVSARMWVFGVPVPHFLALRPDGESVVDGDGWRVNVSLQAPIFGELLRYTGRVWPHHHQADV